MWNTNQELSNKIDRLQKEVEKFSQNTEPTSWYFEWQTWYDKVEWQMKMWNWEEFIWIWWSGWHASFDDDAWSSSVPYDVVVTWVWFQPSLVTINAIHATSGHSIASWGSAHTGDPWNCVYQHDNSDTIVSWMSYHNSKLISLEWQAGWSYPDVEAELKSMDADWFTLTVTRNDQASAFHFNYTCI